MFEIGKVYWLKLKSTIDDSLKNLKGKVLEENSFMVKIQMDDGRETIIPFYRIIDVNEAKEG